MRRTSLTHALIAVLMPVGCGGSVELTQPRDAALDVSTETSSGVESGDSSSLSSRDGSASDSAATDGPLDGPLDVRVPSQVTYTEGGIPICGTTPCELAGGQYHCCIQLPGLVGATGVCQAATSPCPSSSEYIAFLDVECAAASDCLPGQACCGYADYMTPTSSFGSHCRDISTTGGPCTPASTSRSWSAQLCQTSSECADGQCIWQDCTMTDGGAVFLQMTACGVQTSQEGWSCTPH